MSVMEVKELAKVFKITEKEAGPDGAKQSTTIKILTDVLRPRSGLSYYSITGT
jgi:hypothetical protein